GGADNPNGELPSYITGANKQRGLWRRAAARWQELLLNYLQEDDRICIQRRIQHCLKRAKMKSQRATSPSFWPASQ
ncbi:PerC family transcriptional regulator, partial [Escherichia coli]|uniref:PerC family transcriptional regulator n=1 Tax=Escherichia coli TaxID=562 RepID=UPI00201A892D